MTTILTTKNNEREDSDDATSKITIFVKLPPEPNNEEHKNLTRFQVRDSRSKYLGKTCVFRDVEKNKETISELKRKVERETGEKVETLRRGSLLERGAPNKNSKLLQGNAKDAEYFKDAEEIQAKVEKELEEYNAKEDEEREKMFGKGDRKE